MIRRRATLLLGLVGLALLGVGAARVFVTSNGPGLVTLMIVGAVLLVSPFVLARLERLAPRTTGPELRLTREIAELGAGGTAQILDRTDLARYAESYAHLHGELGDSRYDAARAHLQDVLIRRAAAVASQEKFDAAEIRMLFASDSVAMRVLAIGIMKGDTALADGSTILAVIADPNTASEQHQGLELAKLCWHQLSRSTKSAIQSVIVGSSEISHDSERKRLADEVLALPVS